VPRHVAQLVALLVVGTSASCRLVVGTSASCRLVVASCRLVVGNSASRRLVVDYFASAARPGASACRAARHTDRLAAHRRLLRIRRASWCLGTSRSSSLDVDYFA
jgi:hypothetical protein